MSHGATGVLHYPERPDGTFWCTALREGAVRELAHLVTAGSDPGNLERAWLGIIRSVEEVPRQARVGGVTRAFHVELVQPFLQEDVKPKAPQAWARGREAALAASASLSDDEVGPSLSNDEADLIARDLAKDVALGLVNAGELSREAVGVFTTAFSIWMAHGLSHRAAILLAGGVGFEPTNGSPR